MATTTFDRSSRDRIREAAAARRQHERKLTMAVERIANDFEQGRGPTACMTDLLRALGRERPVKPTRPEVVITDQMMKDLKTIEACGFAGAAQAGDVWRGTGGVVQGESVTALTAPKLVARNYDWRVPRLVLTVAGRKALTDTAA